MAILDFLKIKEPPLKSSEDKQAEELIKMKTDSVTEDHKLRQQLNNNRQDNPLLSKLTELAKDPSTYSALASIGSVVAAAEGEDTMASALSNISSRIDQNVRSKAERQSTLAAEKFKAEQKTEQEKLKLKAEEPKRQADIALKKAQEQYNKSQKNKLDLETDLLRNPDPDPKKVLDLEKAKLTNKKLLLEINKLENPEDPEAKRKSEIYNAAYLAYINKINDPKEITFRKRLEEADKVLTNLTKTSEFPYFGKRNVPLFEKRREFRQAQENFINAQLRRESGASIAESEFENARQIYLPVIGDSAEVLEQKRKARALLFAIPEFIDPTEIIKNQEQKQKQGQESVSPLTNGFERVGQE